MMTLREAIVRAKNQKGIDEIVVNYVDGDRMCFEVDELIGAYGEACLDWDVSCTTGSNEPEVIYVDAPFDLNQDSGDSGSYYMYCYFHKELRSPRSAIVSANTIKEARERVEAHYGALIYQGTLMVKALSSDVPVRCRVR